MSASRVLSKARYRRPVVAATILVLAAALLQAVPASAGSVVAARAETGPQRWAGYRVARTGAADGRWIGGYHLGRDVVFLTTPRRRPNRAGLGPVRPVADLVGVSRRKTARAAWLLSKYGGYKDATQAAAVDASVYHLLAGRRWRLDGARGGRRIAQSGDAASVRRFARIMLHSSRRRAGVYSAAVSAGSADLGGTVPVTVRVSDGRGRPAAGLPVSVAMSGADPIASVTADDGLAMALVPARQRGWLDVSARVAQVPEHRLQLRRPLRRGQAAAAEGGVKRTLVASTRAAVRGPQTLGLAASDSVVTAGDPTHVVATIQGEGAPRPAGATLYGPFATAGEARCDGPAVGTTSATVAAEGTYHLAPLAPGAGGYHVWGVTVGGTATSVAASACAATVRVRARTSVAVSAPAQAAPGNVNVTVSVSGIPFQKPVGLAVTVYGPYTSPAQRTADVCNQVDSSTTLQRVGDGSIVSGPIPLAGPGRYYALRAQASPGELWVGSSSPCLATGSLIDVP